MRESCSELARQRGGSMLGTAPHAGAFLVVEARKPWDGKVERSHDFPPSLKGIVKKAESLGAPGVKILGRSSARGEEEPREIRLYRRLPQGRVTLASARHDGTAQADETLLRMLLDPAGGDDAPPTLLVCTHGSRDRCCGTLGHRYAEAFRAAAGEPIEVLEGSHLGGHRFAPTALALPSWRLFGHLEIDEIPDLARHVLAGTVMPGRHRGACWLSAEAQAAEGIPWEHLAGQVSSVEVLSHEKVGGGLRAVVEVAGPEGSKVRYGMVLDGSTYHGPASCADLPEGKHKTFVEYRLRELEAQT